MLFRRSSSSCTGVGGPVTGGKVHGDWLEGRGRVVDDEATVEAAYRALQKKYGWQMTLVNLSSRLFGRIDGRAMLELELDSPVAGC